MHYIYNHELNKGRTECIIKIKALFCHHICNQVQKKQQLNIYTLSFQGQNISPPVQINIIHIKQTCFSFCQWKIIYMLNTLQPPPRELHKWMQEAEKNRFIHQVQWVSIHTWLGLKWHDEQILGSVQQINWINMYGSWTSWPGLTCKDQLDYSHPQLDWPENWTLNTISVDWLGMNFFNPWISQNSPSIGSAMD